VPVAVSTAWGTARSSTVYVGPPQVSSLSPAGGPVTGSTVVTVAGTSLAQVTGAQVDGKPVPFTIASDHKLTLTTPSHAAGPAPITLSSARGTSDPVTFTYGSAPTTAAPRAADAAPRSTPAGPGATTGSTDDNRIGPGWYELARRAARAGR
jgi:hypothetical protein